MKVNKLILLTASFFGIAILANASDKPSQSIILPDVEVNSNSDNLYSGLGRLSTILYQEDIQKAAVKNLDELLDLIAGLDVRQRGAGVQADISIRGGSFDQVLVLLNGINITDPQTGHYNLDIPLDMADVQRIEILQGSAARLSSPNAFSGVINIVTRKTTKRELNIRLDGGSFYNFGQNLSGALQTKRTQFFASASHRSSKGYRPNTDFGVANFFSEALYDSRKWGMLGLQLAYQQKAYGANEFYSFKYPNQFEHTRSLFTALSWQLTQTKFQYSAHAYWKRHHDRFELFRNFENAPSWYEKHNYHLTDVIGAKASISYNTELGKFSLATDIRNEAIKSNVLGHPLSMPLPAPFEQGALFSKEDKRLVLAAIVDYSKQINKWFFSVGGSSAYNRMFGTNFAGGLDLVYNISSGNKIFAAANSTTRLPTFTDLYYTSPTHRANPKLQPERAYTFEMGTKLSSGNYWSGLVLHYRIGHKLIDWIKYPEKTNWESQNLTRVDAWGAELEGGYRFSSREKIGLAYSYLKLDKQAESFDSKYALDYLKHKIVLSAEHRIWQKLSASWKASFFDRSGDYLDFKENRKRAYLPYFLVDLRLLWSQTLVELYADANNMLNSRYSDFGGLEQAGFTFNLGVRLKLQ